MKPVNTISNYIGATIVEIWENSSLAAKIFEQPSEDFSFPFTCDLLTKEGELKVVARHNNVPLKIHQNRVHVSDCSLDVPNIVHCPGKLVELADALPISSWSMDMLAPISGLNDAVDILVEKELKNAVELFDIVCREHDDYTIKISQNEVDFNPFYLDDTMEVVMQILDDENGGLGNILVNPDTMEMLKRQRLLGSDFLNFTLEEANGGIITHHSIPRHTVYALSPPHDLGPMPFKGFSIKSKQSIADKVVFDITEHVGFMVVNPRGVIKITWR